MSANRVIRFGSLPPSRWSNGLGDTVELWRTPVDGDFRVRLSIATVDGDVAFSPLPGIERSLMPLHPHGITLNVDGAVQRVEQYHSIRFNGESAVASVGVVAASRDLNMMLRRGHGAPQLDAITITDGRDFRYQWAAVICLAGELRFSDSDLAFGDTVVVDDDTARLTGSGTVALAYIVSPLRSWQARTRHGRSQWADAG